MPKIDQPLLHKDQENWVAVTRNWLEDDPKYLKWVVDLQGLGKTHAFIGGIEAKSLSAANPSAPAAAIDLWRRYFDLCGTSDSICEVLGDSLQDIGHILATYWVRALWDFLIKATNRNLSRPATIVDAVPRLLDLKELVRLLRVPLAKGVVAQSSSDEHTFVEPIVLEGSSAFAWQVLDKHGEHHYIDRIYLAEQFLRCFGRG